MSDIEQLRRRVEAAERHFGSIGEQQGKYSARLIHLMDQIEQRAADRESELGRYVGELQALRRDHEQVKAMLQALLGAIETGGGEAIMATLHEMDRKASALVGEGPAGEESFTAMDSPAAEEADLEAAGRDDFQNGFEDVTAETLAAEEAALEPEAETDTEIEPEAEIEAEAEAEIEPDTTADRFEDVTPETLAAEEAEEQALAASTDVIAPEARVELEMETRIVAPAPTTAQSPVAGIIQRIGQLTRELAEQPTPIKAPAPPAEPAVAKQRRAAS
ncbi:hypothetical protein FRZ61_11640 [Hypericibacter adhaerens]|uniref:Uncharacterized protein n=1 Tax=Hypericibacter adhaerens TaxID=2602016 RepID=A0A5J6MVC7_9PROT|nr:hypothetical protein [Hypericibacter adhaerens]QEX21241.1 hypothetical protein FRZ61_11640 [Hypericibacter adhaerens]